MTRLFLDANVLFTAAHNSNGKASMVLELAAQGHWQVSTSIYAAEEARRNIARKFPERLERLEQLLAGIESAASGRGTACPLPLRDKDRPIFDGGPARFCNTSADGGHPRFRPLHECTGAE